MKAAAGARLVAVLSRDRGRGEALAAKHGFARAYASLTEALRDPEVDAIYDATPDGLHADNAVAAAESGKHMLVEKPLAVSVAEGVRALAAARRHGTTLAVVFQQRHDAVHQAARRLVRDGAIGEVVLATVPLAMPRPAQAAPPGGGNWRADPRMRPGGIASSIGDHAFDTLAYLVGQEILEVAAMTDATRHDPPDERVSALLLRLSGGAIGQATASFRTPFGRRPIEIHGTSGSLVLRNTYAYLIGAAEDARPTIEIVTQRGRELRHFPPTETFRLEIERFQDAIAGKAAPTTTAEEGLRALAAVQAAYAAARDGRTAKVAEFLPQELRPTLSAG
jgi:1,5-anhydro-D-fructose reductase (1,5-anhydro-D-mannitol-forming)